LFAPVLFWNRAHGWASFAKQGGRGGDWHPAQAAAHIGELLIGQAGLATPLLLAVFCAGLWRLRRAWREPAPALLLALSLLPALLFLQHAVGDRVQANWPAVLYPSAALAAALAGVAYWRSATALGIAVSVLLFIQATAAPLRLPRNLDFSLIRMAGWDDLARDVEREAAAAHASFVAADDYGLASELALRLPGPVIGVEPRWALFNLPPAQLAGQTGILVRSTRHAGAPERGIWPGAVAIGQFARGRGGVTAETYTLYRVAAPHHVAAATLPSAG
jgi:hypothetical protein